MQESKTVVTIQDETLGLAADPVDTGVNILCPIISPSGYTKLTKITGPTQLRNLYNNGASITPNSEQSLKFARALSSKSPIYVKRASRNLLKGGITFGKYPTTFYVDQQNNVIDGQEVKVELNLADVDKYENKVTKIETVSDTSTAFIKLQEGVYVAKAEFINDSSMLKSTTKFDVTPSNVLVFNGDSPDIDVTVEIGGVSYTFNAETTTYIDDFLKEVCAVNSSSQPIGLYGKGYKYIVGGENQPEKDSNGSITAIAFGNEVEITAGDTSTVITTGKDKEFEPLYIYTLVEKTEYISSYVPKFIDFALSFNSGTGDETIHVITEGKEDATITPDYVIEVPATYTYDKFLGYLAEQLNVYTMTDISGPDTFIVVNGTTKLSTSINSDVDVKITVTDLSKPGLDEFGIVSKFPNAGKNITVNLKAVNNDEFKTKEISVTYSKITEDWTFSLEAGAVDGYGNDINYKKINQDSELIEIIPIGGTSSVVQTISMGNEITGDHIGVSGLIAALEYIQEYEESPVNFDYIVDGGVIDASYSSAIISACEVYQSFYPMSCQTSKVTKANLKNNRNRLGSTETFRANFIGAVQSEALLDNGIDTFPGSYYYLSKRLSLANTVREFAPLFGITEGDIGISSPAVEFKKSEREELLDSQIMSLRRSMTTGSYYLNDDLTIQKADSYLQETSTVLMVNTINHVAMNYAETLKGQFNTQQLRDKVTNALTSFISTRLRVGTQNGPDSITVVCDSTNNPQSLINQRKLRIDIYGRFNRSIKDVLIYTHVQPLEE